MTRMVHRLRRLLPICLCLILTVLAAEAAGRILTTDQRVLNSTPDGTTVWKLRWIADRLTNTPRNLSDDPHPVLGWVPKPNLRDLKIGDGSTINTNAIGIRGRRDYGRNKPEGVVRIAVIGDSFSWGEEVNDTDTYASRLEAMLPGTEVMNFSVHGYGIDQMYLRLTSDVMPYRPDIVIFAYIYNDVERTVLEFRDYQKPKFVFSNGNIRLTNVPIPPPDKLYPTLVSRPAALRLMDLIWTRFANRNRGMSEAEQQTVSTLFKLSVSAIRKTGAIPVFIYLPTAHEMNVAFEAPVANEQSFLDFCTKTGLTCLLARRYLSDAPASGKPYDTNHHYNAYMHGVIARGLAADLKPVIASVSSRLR